jgi:soluble lytic murein transglycosylase-like protein
LFGDGDCHGGDDADADGGEGIAISKGSNTTTTTQSPTALPAYQNAINQLQTVGANPYTPYGGELVSPVNQQQQLGISGINQNAYTGIPYLQTAENTLQTAANPLTAGQIQQYYSPYQQDVVGATEAQFNNQNAIQQQQILGNAAAQGALGGDRTAVAQSVLAGQQQAQEAPVIAGLENQGYTQALQTAAGQFQQNPEQAAYGIANTGQAIENAGLTGANAQVGAGTLEQQTQQAADTAAYQQYMMQQFMPESMLSWELPLLTGVGSQEGGTSQTTAPAPNQTAQYAGLGLAALGMFANRGGRVRRMADGGTPGLGGFTPGALPGNPWLAPPNMPRGPGAPMPPKGPGQTVQTPQQMADQATKLAKGIQGAGPGINNLFGQSATYGGGDILGGDVSGGSASSPLPGLDASDYGGGSGSFVSDGLGLFSNRGGRIELRRGGTPIRAGLGMASFMPRRHFDTGGSATDDVAIDDRPSSGWSAALSPVSPVAAAYGAQNPYASAPPADQVATAGIGTAAAPQGGASTDAAPPLAPSPQAAPSAPPQAGIGAAQPNYSPTQHAIVNAARNEGIDPKWALAIAHQESGAQHYDANGNPKVSSAGAIGTMQLMPETAKDLGVNPYDPGQNIQGGVHYLKQMLDRYGGDVQLASAAYNAGPKRVDAFINKGTPLPGETQNYVPNVMAFAGDAASGIGSRGTGLSTAPDSVNAAPAQSRADTQPGGLHFGLGLMSPDAKMGLLSAGLGMMASRSPFLGVGIGQGGLEGLSTYTGLKNREQDVDLKVRQLDQQAKAESDRIGLAAKAQEFAQTGISATEQAKLAQTQQQYMREMQQPVVIGQDIMGRNVMAVRSPDGKGFLDPVTMKPIDPARMQGVTAPSANATGAAMTQPKIGVLPVRDEGMAQQIAHYELPPPSQVALSRQNSPAPMWLARADEISRDETGEPYDGTQFAARNKAALAFAPGGKAGDSIRFFNNTTQHLGTLEGLIGAMDNGPVQEVNRFKQMFQNQFGQTAPGNFEAAKAIVGQEIVKAIVANGGGEAERQAAAAQLAAAKSPEQLRGIIDTYKDLAGAQLRDLKFQYEQGTHRKDFDNRFLIPESQAALAKVEARAAGANAPAATPAMTPQDQQAVAWANAHPADPRAAQIKQRLGIQ